MRKRQSEYIGVSDNGELSVTADTIHEDEEVSLDTGILDKDGKPILRQKQPIGFRLTRA